MLSIEVTTTEEINDYFLLLVPVRIMVVTEVHTLGLHRNKHVMSLTRT